MSTSEQAYEKSTQTGMRRRLTRISSVYDYGFSVPDDRFIPLSPEDLVRIITEDSELFGPDAQRMPEIADLVTRILEQEKAAFERLTASYYAHFNPDRETVEVPGFTRGDDINEATLMRKLGHMLEKANYERLTPEQVDAAIKTGNTQGMRVHLDLDRVDEVSIWVRGRSEQERTQRTFMHPYRGVKSKVAVFNRLVLIVSLHGDEHVHVRMFKDIPIRDIEALLPHARVKMNRRDAIFMLGGGAGAIWSVVTKLTIVGVAAVTNLLWVLALPLAGLSWKVFSGYRRALKDRDSHRARHLYFQNLGSNRSAIHTIATMICDEEIKEALLLYSFCLPGARDRLAPGSLQDLGRLVQNYLSERVGVQVDFDVDDAAETLKRLGLWADADALSTLAVDESIAALEGHWRERRSRNYHAQLLGIAP